MVPCSLRTHHVLRVQSSGPGPDLEQSPGVGRDDYSPVGDEREDGP